MTLKDEDLKESIAILNKILEKEFDIEDFLSEPKYSFWEKIKIWLGRKYFLFRHWFWKKFIYKPQYICCDNCKKSFEAYHWAPTQASGMATAVDWENKIVYGCYGSLEHDLRKFSFNDLPGENICDNCITAMLESGNLTTPQDFHPWDALDD